MARGKSKSEPVAEYPTGTYVKGDRKRVARSAADAVQLRFDGYQLEKAEAPADLPAAPVPTSTETVDS